MLLILADDFSGAAEIAGIAHRYGMMTELRSELPEKYSKDVLVLDTGTRELSMEQAVEKSKTLAKKIVEKYPDASVFKKVDSALRGHIIEEINSINSVMPYEQVLLLPANPSHNRRIYNAHYFINGFPINETEFANDPQYPADSAKIEELLRLEKSEIPAVHIRCKQRITRGKKLITADIMSPDDFQRYLNGLRPDQLCCGAADCFEAWLTQFQIPRKTMIPQSNIEVDVNGPGSLIIQGSCMNVQSPDMASDSYYKFPDISSEVSDKSKWTERIEDKLRNHTTVLIQPEANEVQSDSGKENIETCIQELLGHLKSKECLSNLHIAVTGGSTAAFVMNHLKMNEFTVEAEQAPGVVSLKPIAEVVKFITVKPGSYRWPANLLNGHA